MENYSTVSTDTINDLIRINNDRIAGYQKALDELKGKNEFDLETLFAEIIHQSETFKSELQGFTDEPVEDETTMSGKIYRGWMDIKAIFTGHDRKTILSNCEGGEDAAKKAYKEALSEDLPAEVKDVVLEQQAAQMVIHNRIKALRDNA
ncbi:MAG: PA2169 family four-helix-bundle protein [Arachidicoccus sp.]|nr:PA2169 family four-helix-bundle protein [Arachidicoccus sp.]